MNTTTTPLWEDPVARAMACVGATALSTILLIQYVTIPYVMQPAVELWMSYTAPPFETYIVSPLTETTGTGIVAGLLVVSAASAVILLAASVPMLLTGGVPLAVSYTFWMRLVYKRIE